ncbi:MAG: RNA polymerase sigma factor, partial [Woeseiales bacterium]
RPESAQRRDEIARFVRVTLEHLPSRYARALELKYVQGYSVKEISASLSITEKAVESTLSRARVAFKERFKSIWDIDPNFIVD